MTTLKRIFPLALALLVASAAFGQASLTYTTLASPVTSTSSTTTVFLASYAGVIARTSSIYVNKELMSVTTLLTNSSGATTGIVVHRGSGSQATTHLSGELVYVAPNDYFSTVDRAGSCTATQEVVLPVINVNNGKIFDCQKSVWEEATQVNVPTVVLSLRLSHHIVSLDYAGSTTTGSVSVVGERGLAQIGSATTLTGGYVYGTEGKLRLDGTMTGGWAFGTIGQLDLSNATLTSGSHVGGLWSDAGATGPSVSCTFCDLIVGTNTTATTFNSVIYAYGKAGYLFDLSNNGSAFINSSTGTSGSVTGYLKIKINGADAYIAYKGTPGT